MLEEKIYQEYVEALKAKDKLKADFLSLIRAELKNTSFELRKQKLDENDISAVLKKQLKRLEESKEVFLKSQRAEHIQNLEREIAILKAYLPQALSDEELSVIIGAVIAESNASSIKDMGKVMKEVLARVGVQADAKKVSDLVRARLSPA
jgi:uncharacterized protein YqeY